MNLQFNIDYNTQFGQELVLNVVQAGKKKAATRYRMHTTDGKRWMYDLHTDLPAGSRIDYFYSVMYGEDYVIREEWKTVAHRLELNGTRSTDYVIYDHWIDIPEDSYLFSSAFTDCIHHKQTGAAPVCDYSRILKIKVRAPQLNEYHRLVLVGSEKSLGGWDAKKGIRMYQHNFNEWVADIDAEQLPDDVFDFKFVVEDTRYGDIVFWEDRHNRTLYVPEMNAGGVAVYELEVSLFPIYDVRCAGTLVPVFSLRSKTSFGIGDFGDLKKMIDWVALTKQRLLQILPINDTTTTHTWTDSYPYSCISIFAIHPQYADLNALPQIADEEKRNKYAALAEELNALPQIDYERVNNAKNEYLADLYAQEGKRVLASPEFKAFFAENEMWLVPYAQYCTLRDKFGTADFTTWPDHQSFDEGERAALSDPKTKEYREIAYFFYVQYVLNSQMASVHSYAREKGVILKGDIPIGVSRYGCDVWQEPRYFNLNGQAGAPPDDFSVNGQNWGFPTYNWDEMVKDGCRWWVRRFSNMAKFFDAYRIDHVLGFFRIWEIPIDAVHGLLGQFAPAIGLTREEIEGYGLHFQ
ncbi:MAG: 4-alpha-glucanotransferase, partial [Prevotella sp.]|nr:4-alpha-glucanotransferase [Prevotella sp.]